jgi:hypothetical protein
MHDNITYRVYQTRACCTIVRYRKEAGYTSYSFPMPDNPTYIHKLAGILDAARSPKPIPFFRRRDIEALFGLKKRQAVNLMHRIGAVRVSRELAIPQRDLIRWLEDLISDPAVVIEQRRHITVVDRIVELKAEAAARSIKIVLPDGAPSTEIPPGVSFQPGLLTVAFNNQQELLERLFLLARAFANRPQLLSRVSSDVATVP